jgi:DNA topoisomerase-1
VIEMAKAKKKDTAKPAKKLTRPAQKGRKKKATAATRPRGGGTEQPARKRVAGKSLLVVESPAKARTIKKYLGASFVVKASVGHIKDLPKSKMGIDFTKDFKPEYVVLKKKEKVIDEIRSAAAMVETVYLAPDPDREGEAIAD